MPIRETSRVVEISGRRWKIGKFDALTGSYISIKLISKLSHIIAGVAGGVETDEAAIAIAVASELGSFNKHEFNEIQAECLYVVNELRLVGDKDVETPIRLPDGRWAVGEIENDALLVMTLVAHVIIFNMTSFFDGNALKASIESLKTSISFNAQT